MEKKFKPFDKVIFRPKNESYMWICGFFSNYDGKGVNIIGHENVLSFAEYDILPYEGNEHLVGSDLPADEEVKLEKEERIICNSDVKLLIQGVGFLTTFSYSHGDTFYTGKSRFVDADYNYAIRFKDINPNDMEETKKHILCVENGKIVRYKG